MDDNLEVSSQPESGSTVTENTRKVYDSNQIQLNENNYSYNKKNPKDMTCDELRGKLNFFGIKTKKKDKKDDLVAKYLETMTEPPTLVNDLDLQKTNAIHQTGDISENEGEDFGKKRKSDKDLEAGKKMSKLDLANGNIQCEESTSVDTNGITDKKSNDCLNTKKNKGIAIPMEQQSEELQLCEGNSIKKKSKKSKKTKGGDIKKTGEEVKNVCKTTNINKMKVSELKATLSSLGLSTSGLKPILAERLANAREGQNEELEMDMPTFQNEKDISPIQNKTEIDITANTESVIEMGVPTTQDEAAKISHNSQIDLVKDISGILDNSNNGQLANEDKLVEEPKGGTDITDNLLLETANSSEEDNGKTNENQKPKTKGREAKFLSHNQYSDMTDNLPLGSYDFGEQSVLVMNTSSKKNGVNFHIHKEILKDPSIPKDDLKHVLLESGLKKNEIAITCGLAAQKAFTQKNGKDGTGTQFLKEIDSEFVNSEGFPNITKSENAVRDAFTYALPHATFVAAHEVCDVMLKETKSRELREVLLDILNEKQDTEEGHDRAVLMGLKSAMDKDKENKNDEEYNSSDISSSDEETPEGTGSKQVDLSEQDDGE